MNASSMHRHPNLLTIVLQADLMDTLIDHISPMDFYRLASVNRTARKALMTDHYLLKQVFIRYFGRLFGSIWLRELLPWVMSRDERDLILCKRFDDEAYQDDRIQDEVEDQLVNLLATSPRRNEFGSKSQFQLDLCHSRMKRLQQSRSMISTLLAQYPDVISNVLCLFSCRYAADCIHYYGSMNFASFRFPFRLNERLAMLERLGLHAQSAEFYFAYYLMGKEWQDDPGSPPCTIRSLINALRVQDEQFMRTPDRIKEVLLPVLFCNNPSKEFPKATIDRLLEEIGGSKEMCILCAKAIALMIQDLDFVNAVLSSEGTPAKVGAFLLNENILAFLLSKCEIKLVEEVQEEIQNALTCTVRILMCERRPISSIRSVLAFFPNSSAQAISGMNEDEFLVLVSNLFLFVCENLHGVTTSVYFRYKEIFALERKLYEALPDEARLSVKVGVTLSGAFTKLHATVQASLTRYFKDVEGIS